jgi:hypothetical protein
MMLGDHALRAEPPGLPQICRSMNFAITSLVLEKALQQRLPYGKRTMQLFESRAFFPIILAPNS